MFSRSYIVLLVVLILGTRLAGAQSPTPSVTPYSTDKQGKTAEALSGVPAIAPDFASRERTLPDLGRVGVDMTAQLPMTLGEAITLALENNRDIEVTRKNVLIAEYDLRAARGFYEPRFTGGSYYEKAGVANVSFFTPNILRLNTNTTVANFGLQTPIATQGTSIATAFNNQRLTTDNPVSILSPQHFSSLSVSLIQPLFRGRRIDQPRRVIQIAKRNLSLTDAQFRQKAVEIVASVERAYWDLTYALRNLQVQRDGVRDAKAQLEHNRRLVDEGQLAPIDIVAAETQVANYEQAVFDALNIVNAAENALKNLILPSRNDAVWAGSITPIDDVKLETPAISLDEAISAAIQNRPELDLNRVQKEINDIDVRYYRNLAKPQIDLTASYTSSGIGGDANPNFSSPFCANSPNPAACNAALLQPVVQNVGGPWSVFPDIFANRYPSYRIGVQFNLPMFGDRTARAQFGRAKVEGDRLDVQREALEQAIQVDVRNAMQVVRTAEARLRFASIARENSAKQYESERRKLDSGQSDIYRVLERQTALTQARSNELRAQTELNKAIAELARATGNSLKANNIDSKK